MQITYVNDGGVKTVTDEEKRIERADDMPYWVIVDDGTGQEELIHDRRIQSVEREREELSIEDWFWV